MLRPSFIGNLQETECKKGGVQTQQGKSIQKVQKMLKLSDQKEHLTETRKVNARKKHLERVMCWYLYWRVKKEKVT